ncbi:AMIN domain-containing protein [Desulfocurvus sp. DL9XJH121]
MKQRIIASGQRETKNVKCSNCGNDLMVHEVRKGLARLLALLPVASYTCVRCGKTSLGPGDLYASGPARAALAVALVAVLALGGLWLFHRGGPELGPHSIRCEVNPETPGVAAPGTGPAALPAAADNATAPLPAPAEAAAEPAAVPTTATETLDAAPAEDTAATGQADDETAETNSTAQDEPSPPLPAAVAEEPPAEEPPLEEIVVQAPPKPVRPSGQPRGVGTAARAGLKGVRTGIWNGALVVTLDVDGKPGRPSGFSLDSPPRYVVDIPGRWSYPGERVLPVGQGKGKALRLGVHDDHLRVVLDLSAAPEKASVRVTDQGIVITVR